MLLEDQKCPHRMKCEKYKEEGCLISKSFSDCEIFIDFECESPGRGDTIIKYVMDAIERLKKVDKIEKQNKKKLGQCPLKLNCYHIFEVPCHNRRLDNECCDFMCEDCELNIPDYGLYCETGEFERCESYKILSNLKKDYGLLGIHNTKDLKEYYGEENYEWLGGFIRCAFMEIEEI